MRERGNTFVNGVEIEYFINPIKEVRHYFATEVGNKAPCTAHMFANSKVLHKKGSMLESLIKEAKNIIHSKREKMSNFELEFAKYFIDDMIKDLEDVYLKKDIFAFNIIANEIIAKSLEIFYKTKRKQKEKSKRLKTDLKKIDPIFEKILSDAVSESKLANKYKKMRKLAEYVENLVGGKRPKEWKLISKCSYLSK